MKMKMKMKIGFVAISLQCVVFAGAQTPQFSASQLLAQAEGNRNLVLREVARMDGNVEAEVERVLQSMDELAETRFSKWLEAHHMSASNIIQRTTLPETVSNTDVLMARAQVVIGNMEAIREICEKFLHRAMVDLEAEQERFMTKVEQETAGRLTAELEQAQTRIRQQYFDSLGTYFPEWQGVNLPPPPSAVALNGTMIDTPEGELPIAGMAGLVVLMLTRIIRRIILAVFKKVMGKVLVRVVPIVGWLLILVDVAMLPFARGELEKEIRALAVVEYQEALTLQALWQEAPGNGQPAMREAIQQRVREGLQQWSDLCKEEVLRILDAARVLHLSPNVQAYLKAQEERGRTTREVVEDLLILWETFGMLVAHAPIETLFDIRARATDPAVLRRLVEELEGEFLVLYEKHGAALLSAADWMGPELLLKTIRAGDGAAVNWQDAARVFRRFPRTMRDSAKRGLLHLLETVGDPGMIAEEDLARIGRRPELLLGISPQAGREKVFELLADEEALEVIRRSFGIDAEATHFFSVTWPGLVWRRYAGAERLEALHRVARYRRLERGQSNEAFAAEMLKGDRLTPLLLEQGLDAVRIWDAHVRPGTGRQQEERAKEALALFGKGYPAEDLVTLPGLERAMLFNRVPVVGRQWYELAWVTRPVLWGIALLVFLVLALPILAALLRMWRMLRGEPQPRAPLQQIVTLSAEPDTDSPALQGQGIPYSLPPRREETGTEEPLEGTHEDM